MVGLFINSVQSIDSVMRHFYEEYNRSLNGRLKAYYYRFKIIENPTCICGGGNQTAYHLLYGCKLYKKE